MYVSISPLSVDNAMWRIQRVMIDRYGIDVDRSDQLMGPLHWWVSTGRATPDFLRKMITCKPLLIARRLMRNGSDEEIVQNIKKCIGYTDD